MKKAAMKKMKYEGWEIHPELAVKLPVPPLVKHVIWRSMSTKHEGNILYCKLWNFWVRAGTKADLRSDRFLRDYSQRKSIGMESFDSVDYQHPLKIIPVPLSGFESVPYLPD